MKRMLGWAVAGMVIAVNLAACATTGEPTAATGPSLYQRLGGREGIAGIVDDFVANVVADPRVNRRFTSLPPAQVSKLKSNLADQICDATGGPCAYVGRDMKETHKGMSITEAEWDATVENLVKALAKRKVDARSQQELLAALGPMRKDIVGQ